MTGELWPVYTLMTFSYYGLNSIAEPSADPETTRGIGIGTAIDSYVTANEVIGPMWSLNVWISSPVSRFHSLTVSSREPDTKMY